MNGDIRMPEPATDHDDTPAVNYGLADFFGRLFREKRLGTLGAAITLVMLLCAIFADLIAPYPLNMMGSEVLQPSSWSHPLGTDNLGRDILSQIIYGARVSMVVGLAAAALATIVSTTIGILSGYIGGVFDMIAQRIVDAVMALPWLILTMVIISFTGPGMIQLILVLGISWGIGGSRTTRGLVMSVKENMYVFAAVAIGSKRKSILLRHILPNIMAPVIVGFSGVVPGVILTESSLSFLGFGIPPPAPSWGSMLSGQARSFMYSAPWMALWPGVALVLAVYGVNVFGDAVRDLLDPKLRGGLGRYGLEPGGKGKKRSVEEERRS